MLIDAHAHLDKYGDLLDDALRQIEQEQIFTIATAMDLSSYLPILRIAEMSDLVLPTFGIHPRRAPEYADHLSELNPIIEQSRAIGEIGLDFHWVEDSSQYPAQIKVLEYFLAAAREQKKFVNLHTKGAEQEILKAAGALRHQTCHYSLVLRAPRHSSRTDRLRRLFHGRR